MKSKFRGPRLFHVTLEEQVPTEIGAYFIFNIQSIPERNRIIKPSMDYEIGDILIATIEDGRKVSLLIEEDPFTPNTLHADYGATIIPNK